MNLTDEQLNLAMAEWMGWKKVKESDGEVRTFDPQGICRFADWEDYCPTHVLPNYLSDDSPRRLLNEAEARLTDEQAADYSNILVQMWWDTATKRGRLSDWMHIHANARQRCIAILKTVKPEMFQ